MISLVTCPMHSKPQEHPTWSRGVLTAPYPHPQQNMHPLQEGAALLNEKGLISLRWCWGHAQPVQIPLMLCAADGILFFKSWASLKWIADGGAEDTKISWRIVLTELLEVLQVTDHPKLILSAISEGLVSCITSFQKELATQQLFSFWNGVKSNWLVSAMDWEQV